MFRYSLSELFYWLTLWIVAVSLLATLTTAAFAVFVVTVWLFGTVFINKALGRRAGLAYAVLIGFVLMATLMWPSIEPAPRRRPSIEIHLSLSLLSGLISGTSVWFIAATADEAWRQSARRRSA